MKSQSLWNCSYTTCLCKHPQTHIRTYTRIHHCIDVVKLIYAFTSDSRTATVTSALKQGQRVHHFDLQPEPSSQLNPQHCKNNGTLLEVWIWDCDPVRHARPNWRAGFWLWCKLELVRYEACGTKRDMYINTGAYWMRCAAFVVLHDMFTTTGLLFHYRVYFCHCMAPCKWTPYMNITSLCGSFPNLEAHYCKECLCML